MAGRAPLLTTVQAIRTYWAPWLVQQGRADSVAEVLASDWCFACGMSYPGPATAAECREAEAAGLPEPLHTDAAPCQRAHILARIDGGDDGPANLHMLCRWCHKASEFLWGEDYWAWFASRTVLDVAVQAHSASGSNLGALLRGDPLGVWMRPRLRRPPAGTQPTAPPGGWPAPLHERAAAPRPAVEQLVLDVQRPRRPRPDTPAEAWLRGRLAGAEAPGVDVRVLYAEGVARGFSRDLLQATRRRLGATVYRDPIVRGGTHYWRLAGAAGPFAHRERPRAA